MATGRRAGSEKAGIHLLSNAVIDQIAAGEVIERPASVVKELVENALDADATRIAVDVRDGGAALVAVTDDGVGMSPADAQLAIQRHATSKLSSAADLEQILSFGFRGEALPSIASVSRMRLRTRVRGAASPEAYEIRIEGGEIVSQGAVGGAEGTRIEVADLFANVPARRKFLKRAATEWGHSAEWLSRLALALPEVHFELRRDDRPPIVWPATADRLVRVAAVLGEDAAAALVAGDRSQAGVDLELFISVPEHTRANTSGLYFFVNGRPVRDRLLNHAIIDVCRDALPRGRFPTAVAFLRVDPSTVDVNVHPAKWEVRFAEPRTIHSIIRAAVRDAYASRSWLGPGRPTPPGGAPAGATGAVPAPPPASGVGDRDTLVRDRGPSADAAGSGDSDWLFAGRTRERGASDAATGGSNEDARLRFGGLRRVGQLLASYLLLEGPDGLVIVDQHAAHERVLYERLRSQWLERRVERQPLLFPQTLELEPSLASALVEAADAHERLGFEIDAFGEAAVVVRAVPALLAERDPARLVRELAEALAEPEGHLDKDGDATRMLAALDYLFATLACHSARRFGDRIPDEEQAALLSSLDELPWAATCPHGRPVAVPLEQAEIERRFARR